MNFNGNKYFFLSQDDEYEIVMSELERERKDNTRNPMTIKNIMGKQNITMKQS